MEGIFKGQRFEIEFVGGVVVCGGRFGIGVDHDRLVPQLFEGKRRMDAAVVKFDALADPVGTSSQNHDLLLRRNFCLILNFVSGVIVGGIGFKFRTTGVHQFICRLNPLLLPHLPQGGLVHAKEMSQLEIREAKLLCFSEKEFRKAKLMRNLNLPEFKIPDLRPIRANLLLQVRDLADIVQKPRIDLRQLVDFLNLDPQEQSMADVKNSFGIWSDEFLSDFLKILSALNGDLCRKGDLVLSVRSQTVSSIL